MTDHIGEATQKVIDLDALEKRLLILANAHDWKNGSIHNAEMKALALDSSAAVAELKEARGLLKGMCDAYEIVCDDSGMRYHLSPTSKYAASRAFLARNGKGEG